MKKLLSILMLIGLFSVTSCDLDLLDNPNAVTEENAEIDLFFNQIQLDFARFFNRASDLTMPVVRMMAMTSGNTYNNNFLPETFNSLWNDSYAALFPDIDAMNALAEPKELFVHSGAAKVLKAYTLMTLVDLFGDIPWSEAGQGVATPSPLADDDESVYAVAVAILDDAIEDLGKTATGSPANDLFYDGDGAAWLKAANTLKMRYYLTTRLVNSESNSGFAAILNDGNFISAEGDDMAFQYGTNRSLPDSRHPYYVAHYETGGNEYLSNYFMWTLDQEKGLEDPRLRYYFYRQDCDTTDEDLFTLDCPTAPRPDHYTGDYPWCTASDDGYWGRDHGNDDGIPPDNEKKTTYGLYPGAGEFDADQCASVKNQGTDGAGGNGIEPLMLSSFVDFMRAEAAMTMGTGEDARALLESGIRASITKVLNFIPSRVVAEFEPSMEDVDTYVNITLSLYDNTDDAGKMEVIAKEYYIALWGNGIDAYNMYRRTGLPGEMQPVRQADPGDFPRLMVYPADYVNLNANASQRTITDQVFWDNNPAGFIN